MPDSAGMEVNDGSRSITAGAVVINRWFGDYLFLSRRGVSAKLRWSRRSALHLAVGFHKDASTAFSLGYQRYLVRPLGIPVFGYAMVTRARGGGNITEAGLGLELRLRKRMAFTADLGFGYGGGCCTYVSALGVHYRLGMQ